MQFYRVLRSSTNQTKDTKAYLDRFADFVRKNKVDVAVLCGSHTNLKHKEKSETGTMAEYLRKHIGNNVRVEWRQDRI